MRLAAKSADPRRPPEERLRGGCATGRRQDWGRTTASSNSSQCPQALNLRPARLVVDAPLPARLPLEVLHRVRDVDAALPELRLRRATHVAVDRRDRRTGDRPRSSPSPGCSPTSMRPPLAPSPKTVCVAFAYSGQRMQSAASRRMLQRATRCRHLPCGSFPVDEDGGGPTPAPPSSRRPTTSRRSPSRGCAMLPNCAVTSRWSRWTP